MRCIISRDWIAVALTACADAAVKNLKLNAVGIPWCFSSTPATIERTYIWISSVSRNILSLPAHQTSFLSAILWYIVTRVGQNVLCMTDFQQKAYQFEDSHI